MALILASASPRRRELLRAAGIEFAVEAANLPEEPRPGEAPRKFAERLAREKARAVFGRQRGPAAWVLGADTVVIVDHAILGKPADEADAARMLRLLSGRTHKVITGVCLVGSRNGEVAEDVRSETTLVHMDPLSAEEIRDYVASGEPMDKAGAYAIQGVASRWISRIEGCYFNVVGLPVPLVHRMMREQGCS
ncbi:MAG TPA: Maf family protein [Terriglobales bacterium]|nr:Maf family protein [Terriglobales bacterium]